MPTPSMYTTLASAQGIVPIDLTHFRAIASNNIPAQAGTPIGGLLCGDSAPKLLRTNAATDKSLAIQWAASSSIEITAPFIYPPDMNILVPYTVNFQALMNGATDTPTVAVGVFEGIGDTNRGATSAAMTAAIAQYSVSITATAAFPNFAIISLTPGAHTTNILLIYNVWIQYTKQLLSS